MYPGPSIRIGRPPSPGRLEPGATVVPEFALELSCALVETEKVQTQKKNKRTAVLRRNFILIASPLRFQLSAGRDCAAGGTPPKADVHRRQLRESSRPPSAPFLYPIQPAHCCNSLGGKPRFDAPGSGDGWRAK